MTTTTVNNMNLLLERNESRINAKVPKKMKELIEAVSERLNMNESQYIKLAIKDRLEKDLEG